MHDALKPRTVSRVAARRFLVARHLLAPPRALPARPEEVLAVVRRFGSLQFDPLEAPGAKNHELVLHARIRGYEKGWCERFLYGPDRRLFEAYNKSLNILPIEELPFHRAAWVRGAERWGAMLDAHAREVDDVLATIATEGPLPTTYFSKRIAHVLAGGWGPTKAGRLIVEGLFKTGRLGIARRAGNARFYDLVERLFPADVLARRVAPREELRHRLVTRFRGHGLLGAGGQAEITVGTGTAATRRAMIEELVAEGVLAPVAVEGVRGARYLLAEEAAMLDAGPPPRAVTFLAPLDPFVWDRRLLRELFDFTYTWEVYTPAAKRAHGYYVLPLLYGDRLVARLEPRFDRASGRLEIA
ncbi:MAG TPA: crosslink repair DNA glycosylase YcaQ family protein, partial [Minicystis sp.]|nr:crosslink repair DNA glycosylase YcaQ family protein [Minicystis sp.]